MFLQRKHLERKFIFFVKKMKFGKTQFKKKVKQGRNSENHGKREKFFNLKCMKSEQNLKKTFFFPPIRVYPLTIKFQIFSRRFGLQYVLQTAVNL